MSTDEELDKAFAEARMKVLQKEADELVEKARKMGFNLTIEQTLCFGWTDLPSLPTKVSIWPSKPAILAS